MTKRNSWCAAALSGLVALVSIPGGLASAQTAAQLQLLSQLSPAEQQRLRQQFLGSKNLPTRTDEQLQQPVLLQEEQAPQPPEAPVTEYSDLEPPRAFGYELFRARPTTFAPVTDVPVPADYTLGPGDALRLVLYGKESGDYTLRVDRSGNIFLPDLGPLSVAGLGFDLAREQVLSRIRDGKIGVNASLQMGELRSMRIFVAGDARYPGSYTVSGLATMLQALYISGGVKEIGSLRGVQLRRSGETVSTMDLYDLLLRGDTRGDERLKPGDVVFVPPVAETVTVQGAVRRPAIYELRGESTLTEILALAGGVKAGAVLDRATVERVANGRRTLVRTVVAGSDSSLRLRGGDIVRIHAPLEQTEDGVNVVGPARWPGRYALDTRARLTSVLRSADDLKPFSDLDFALLLRRSDDGAGLRPVYLHPRRAFSGDRDADERLEAGDELHVFSNLQLGQSEAKAEDSGLTVSEKRTAQGLGLADDDLESDEGESEERAVLPRALRESRPDSAAAMPGPVRRGAVPLNSAGDPQLPSRQQRMVEMTRKLEALARDDAPPLVVEVSGAVRFPGRVPLDINRNRVVDVLRAVGGLRYNAETAFVDISRAPQSPGAGAAAEQIIVRTDSAAMASVRLQPGDVLSVRAKPGADDQRSVTILGEVTYPGNYFVAAGTTLAELLLRAGGVSAEGFPKGAVFTRAELRRKEEYQVDRLRERLRGELAAASLTKAGADAISMSGLSAVEGLFDELAQYEALGRLVIDLPAQIQGTAEPLTLEDGDTLIIPKLPEEVMVLGEVQFPSSHRWESGLRRNDYIRRAGGFTQLADGRRAFVVKADGSVFTEQGWFGGGPVLEVGDVVVVPLDATPIGPLTLFSSVSQVIYQLALTVAAFNSVGAF